MAGLEHAIFVLNKQVEQDPVLASIFSPKRVMIYPGFADEPSDTEKSYPYIRYQFITVPTRSFPYFRRDWCQYFVGDTSFDRVVNAVERLIYILNLEAFQTLDLPVKDYSGKYKISDIVVYSTTIPNQPSQDLGVWEQGVSFSLRYVVRVPSWSVQSVKTHGLDIQLA